MSKSHGGRSKNKPQLTQHFNSPTASKEASGAASTTAGSRGQLTLEMLVGELEKLRKSVTGELTNSLHTALAPINASLQSITDTVAAHANTISEMETALTAHSDGLSTLDNEVSSLKSKLESTMQANEALQLAVEDLISRSKRKNLRIIGIPEGAEGSDARLFMSKLLKELTGDTQQDLELERAHRGLTPRPSEGCRPFIIRFHKYIHKERVLLWAKKNRDISFRGQSIRIFEDFSTTLAKKRAKFNKVKSLLYIDGIRFGMVYPARLRVTINGQTRTFDSAEDAELFYQNFKSK